MRAKTFVQVSIGIMALGAAYELGASKARAEVQAIVAAFSQPVGGTRELWAYTQNGDVYVSEDSGLTFGIRSNVFSGIGANSQVADAFCNPATTNEQWVFATDGSVYLTEDGGATFTLRSNVFVGGATPLHSTSFGDLKVRYR